MENNEKKNDFVDASTTSRARSELYYSFFHSFIHSKKEKYVPTYYIISITTGESDTKLHHLPLPLTFLGGITDAGWDGGGCSVAMLAIVPSISIKYIDRCNYRVTAVLHVEYPCVKERRYIRGHTIPIFNKVSEILCARTVVLNAFAVLMKHLFRCSSISYPHINQVGPRWLTACTSLSPQPPFILFLDVKPEACCCHGCFSQC